MNDQAQDVSQLFDEPEPEARRVAVQRIAAVRTREALDLLLRALGDDDWRVRKEAASLAPSLQPREELIAALLAALEDTVNIGLRNAAVEALIKIGPDAVSTVIGALAHLDADARKLAVEVLGGASDPRAVEAVVRELDDEDANVRVAAAEALAGAALAGEPSRALATEALVTSLATNDTFVKIAALESLSRLDARLPWKVFEPHATDPLLRRYSIAAASGSREDDAVRALARATGDESSTVAREAFVALGDMVASDPGDEALLACVREALAEVDAAGERARRAAGDWDDPRKRGGALVLLGLRGAPGDVLRLVEALGDEDVGERAELALRLVGSDAIRPLLSAAGDKPPLRAAALRLAASLVERARDSGERATGAAPPAHLVQVRAALRRALDDASPEVLTCALDALSELGDARDLKTVSALTSHLDDRVEVAAANAVAALAARHPTAAQTLLRGARKQRDPLVLVCVLLGAMAPSHKLREDDVRVLELALAHDNPRVRRAAIEALSHSRRSTAAEAVAFALSDEEQEVRLAAVRALGRLGCTDPLVRLAAAAGADPVVLAAALRVLGEVDADLAVDTAGPLVRDPGAAVACAAVEVLGRLAPACSARGTVACERAMLTALEHPDTQVVKLALSLLGARPLQDAFSRVAGCLDHRSWEVRRAAAERLGRERTPGAEALLRARYGRETDPVVRDVIAQALSLRPLEAARAGGGEGV